ncbi:MAG: hypothetical protein EXQ52_14385 [Bryobacterales bacterium]|nr:hypothetical protein [Bryobacterales bacterium]
MEVKGDAARQIVRVTEGSGKTAVYLFTLSKQKEAPYKDCWMTDGVMRVADEAGPAKIAGTAGLFARAKQYATEVLGEMDYSLEGGRAGFIQGPAGLANYAWVPEATAGGA